MKNLLLLMVILSTFSMSNTFASTTDGGEIGVFGFSSKNKAFDPSQPKLPIDSSIHGEKPVAHVEGAYCNHDGKTPNTKFAKEKKSNGAYVE